MGNLAERDDDPQTGGLGDRSAEKLPACVDFCSNWFVGWWHASNCIGDRGGVQLPVVVSLCRGEWTGKTVVAKCLEKETAGIVTRERNAGAIGAAQSGRETDDQQLYRACAFRWIPCVHRTVVPIRKPGAVLESEVVQPWAEAAIVIWLVFHNVMLCGIPPADQSSSKSSSSSSTGAKARCGRSEGSRPISDLRLFKSIK